MESLGPGLRWVPHAVPCLTSATIGGYRRNYWGMLSSQHAVFSHTSRTRALTHTQKSTTVHGISRSFSRQRRKVAKNLGIFFTSLRLAQVCSHIFEPIGVGPIQSAPACSSQLGQVLTRKHPQTGLEDQPRTANRKPPLHPPSLLPKQPAILNHYYSIISISNRPNLTPKI